jgi:hypothetical protein
MPPRQDERQNGRALPVKLALFFSAAFLLHAGTTAAFATEIATVAEDHLACYDRADSVRFIHFEKSGAIPDVESLQNEMEKSGRCIWWRKGDKVAISEFDNGDGVTVAAQKPPDRKFLFFDRCFLEEKKWC